MNVSLDQAIESTPRRSKHRFGKRAALLAEEKADHCAAGGDDEGYAVWLRVASVAGSLPEVRSLRPLVDEVC
jgi:hypothetical protein